MGGLRRAGMVPLAKVRRYDLDFDLSQADLPEVGEYPAVARIRLEASEGRSIAFSLDPRRLTVERVSSGGRDLTFRIEGERLIVDAGDALEVRIQYRLTSTSDQSGYGLIEDPENQRLWSMTYPMRTGALFPSNPHPSDAAKTRIQVQVPEGWERKASGAPTNDRFVQTVPTPAHAAGIYAASSYEAPATARTDSGIEVVAYGGRDLSRPDIRSNYVHQTRLAIEFFERWLGPYEFGQQMGIVEIPGVHGGMEHGAMVALMSRASNDPELAPILAIHEASHHWFGDNVRIEDWPHLWLSEGFAEYLTLRAVREISGENAFKSELRFALLDLEGELGPSTDGRLVPEGTGPERAFSGIPYKLGAWMLRLFEVELGTERFDSVMRAWFQEKRGQPVNTQMLLSFIQQRTGVDVRPLFDRWCSLPEVPHYLTHVQRLGPRALSVGLREGGLTPPDVAVPLRLCGTRGEALTVRVAPGPRQRLEAPFEIASAEWDPDRTLPVFLSEDAIR